MQITLKIIFTVVILFVCIFLLGMNNMLVMTNIPGFGGALSMMIIGGATLAAIRAVWKYKRKDKEVSSNMPKLDKDA
jgi:amino acid transporter